MICLLCKQREVQDPNPAIKICDLCRMEIEMSFTFYIGGKEVTREEYERRINEERFK